MMRIMLFLLTNFAVMLVVGIILSVLGVGQNPSSLIGLLGICFVYGMVGSLISLFLSKFMAKRSTGTQVITQPQNQTEQWLVQTVTDLAAKAGIKTPEIGIFPSDQSNAFATGWNKNAALVAVSSGILNRMQPEELKAVLAHEIGHVANGDMVTLALIQGVMNAFVFFFARIVGEFIDRAVFKHEGEGHGISYFVINMALQMAFGVLASVVTMWFSRHREYRADEAGAKFASKQGMIAALQSLAREHEPQHPMPENMNAVGINGGKEKTSWFATHPSIEQRIAALQQLQV